MNFRRWYDRNAWWLVMIAGFVILATASFSVFYDEGYRAALENQGLASEQPAPVPVRFLGERLTEWISALSGFLAVVVSAVALVVLLRTLKATNKATEEAAKAADEARKANEIMQEDGRAWITVDLSPNGALGKLDISVLTVGYRQSLRNIGRRPAINVYTHVEATTVDIGPLCESVIDDFVDEVIEESDAGQTGTILFPNKPHETNVAMMLDLGFVRHSGGAQHDLDKHMILMHCVVYRSAGSHTTHYMAQAFVAHKTSDVDNFPHGWYLSSIDEARRIA